MSRNKTPQEAFWEGEFGTYYINRNSVIYDLLIMVLFGTVTTFFLRMIFLGFYWKSKALRPGGLRQILQPHIDSQLLIYSGH